MYTAVVHFLHFVIEIVKIDKEKEWLYITFLYWGDAWDMWLPQDSPNIAPLHTHTYADKGCLKPRQRIDVYDLIKRKHLEAFVTEAKSTEVCYSLFCNVYIILVYMYAMHLGSGTF